jgi:hypothetical protein
MIAALKRSLPSQPGNPLGAAVMVTGLATDISGIRGHFNPNYWISRSRLTVPQKK